MLQKETQMPLHPQAKALLQAMIDAGAPPMETMTPDAVRLMRREQVLRWNLRRDPSLQVEDRRIPGPEGEIPIRVYVPPGEPPYPALIYFHGGGWVLGDLDAYDHVCAMLATTAHCMVASVAYRLAPEHPFPAGLDDAYAAMQWALTHASEIRADADRIAVGGDSAGANFATEVCYLARERGGRLPIRQVLIYPITMPLAQTKSQELLAEGYNLTAAGMRWFLNHYAPAPDAAQNPLVFPMLIGDLKGMPPALIVTAEYDPLRDEGEAYAQRLREAGVPVTLTRYPGMIHGFLTLLPPMDPRGDLVHEVSDYLNVAFTRV